MYLYEGSWECFLRCSSYVPQVPDQGLSGLDSDAPTVVTVFLLKACMDKHICFCMQVRIAYSAHKAEL